MCSKVLNGHIILTDTSITTILAPEMTYTPDFMEQVNILLDSRRYCRECEILGLKPEYVAEHIVFLGSATMKKVLKDGVSRTLGADVQLYGKRFSPEDADRFLSEDIKRLPEHATVA